jgi:hypothetical protein
MTLTTYAGLLSSVAAWLNRDDLTATIPDFVALAEADMCQRLRLRAMLARVGTTLDEGYETLPGDCLGIRRLTLDGVDLGFAPAGVMAAHSTAYVGDVPTWYSVIGNQIQVSPVPASTSAGALEMLYYARPPALSDTNQSNVLLAASPAIYLYGSLIQSAPFLGDDQRLQVWVQMYQEACNVLQSADDAAEYPGPLVIRSGAFD